MSDKTHIDASSETIEGTVKRVLFRGDDDRFAVALLALDDQTDVLRIAGELGGLGDGDRVRLIGRYRQDARFGHQFKVSACQPILPHTESGLIAYLSSGRIPSIGPKLAQRLVDYFSTETLDIIIHAPNRLCEVDGIGPKRSKEICEQVTDQVFQRDALIFLQGLELGPALANRIWHRYHEQTIHLVRENPYRLAEEVGGIGFKTADQIAQTLGFSADSPIRAAAALIHMLGRALEDGHVYLPKPELVTRVEKLIGDDAPIGLELDRLIEEGRLIDDGGLYLKTVLATEIELAEQIEGRLMAEIDPLQLDDDFIDNRLGLSLADEQQSAVELASKHPLLILTGGPGTGKTTTVRAIQKMFATAGLQVTLAAPTGRASRRLAEATGVTASTIHRLLGYHPVEGFRHDENEPLEGDAFIIDEVSMLDQNLAIALMRAIPSRARIVFVGDSDQLPSVGAGNVLSDLMASGRVETMTLTTVHRQANDSQIVTSAYQILNGQQPDSGQPSEESDFFIVPADTPERAAELIETMIKHRIPNRFELDPVEDIQVLTPMHRGVCGANRLNERLQMLLNPDGRTVRKGPVSYRVGDKVMQQKNDYQKDVFNGDVGRIIAQSATGAVIRFDQRVIEYDREGLDRIGLAYACSVHKSQGSEYPAVIVPVLTEHWLMLQRNLLYTAVTRGKQLVIVVGQEKALMRAIRNTDGLARYTQLNHRLRQFQ
ncbi:MAG: ATP-dependent RecD-like DNA helicase [Myxococcales bacterium]|nr:ATP-dependent RecD-like DNA helicase [Myxococcales bacterium]